MMIIIQAILLLLLLLIIIIIIIISIMIVVPAGAGVPTSYGRMPNNRVCKPHTFKTQHSAHLDLGFETLNLKYCELSL